LHPVLSLEAEASPFVRAFKIVWSASTSSRRSPGELASDELTAVLLDSLITLMDDNKTVAAIPDHLARTGVLSLVLSLATCPEIPVALLARCCDVITLAKSSLINRSVLGKVVNAVIDAHVNSTVILRSAASEAATAAVTRATVVFELVTDLAQCQQTAAKVGPRLVEDGWIEMLKPIPSGRQPITPTLQAAVGRMVLALCENLIVSESAVETLWRRAVENKDADAFMTMAVISCHTSKMAGLMGSLVKTKSDCADMTTACHGNLMHAIYLHFREDSDFRPYR
ncbi:hypothetical protein FOZ63_007222, partial [Perkinsus olseni]